MTEEGQTEIEVLKAENAFLGQECRRLRRQCDTLEAQLAAARKTVAKGENC